MRLKTKIAIANAATLAMAAVSRGQVIASYNFGSGGTFTADATTLAANVTAGGLEDSGNFGTNDTFSPDTGVGGESGWYSNNPSGNYLSVANAGSSTDNGYWVQVDVTAAAGYVINPTSFELFGGAGGSSAVRSAYIFDNVDGYPTNMATSVSNNSPPTITGGDLLTSGTFTAVRGTGGTPAMNEIQVASFPSDDQNLTSFTVRVYFDTEGLVGKNIDLGQLELDGSVVSSGPVTQSTWVTNGSGDYNNPANWSSGVPSGAGAEADFLGAITASNVVYTDSSVTLGKIVFNNSNSYELDGAVGTNLTLQSSSSALVDVQSGTHEINLPLVLASNTTFETDSSTASLVIANPMTINSGVTLTTTGSGTVTYQSIVNVGSNASIAFASSTYANTLNLAANSTATVSAPLVELDNLSDLGTLNVKNNEVLINYAGGSDPIAAVAGYLNSGFNNGHWNGPGIISTNAQTLTNGLRYGLGWADSADHIVAGLSSGEIEIKYTLLGDANLDGTVNGSDFSILAANFGLGHTNWDQGNFLYTSSVNGSDFSALASNFGQGASGAGVTPADIAALDAFAAANGLTVPTVTAVPEPVSGGLLALGALGLLGRRRLGAALALNSNHTVHFPHNVQFTSEERVCE